jgi:hypothetical protein
MSPIRFPTAMLLSPGNGGKMCRFCGKMMAKIEKSSPFLVVAWRVG